MVTRCPPEVGPTFGEMDVTAGPGGVPDPLRATAAGLPTALLAKLSDAARLPLDDGLNVTTTVHVAFAARVWVEQLSVTIVYSAALVPVSVTAPAPNTRLAFPLLVTVTVCWADVWPTRVAGIVGAGAENPGPSMEKVFESFDASWSESPAKEAEAPAVLEPRAVLLL